MIATQLGNTFRLFSDNGRELSNLNNLASARTGVAFAPDGKIVYEGNDGDIWTINPDGGEQRQLTNNSFRDFYPKVSPDGRYIFLLQTGVAQIKCGG